MFLKDAFKTCFQADTHSHCRMRQWRRRVEIRDICYERKTVFGCLQASIFPLGYRLAESGRERVGQALSESMVDLNEQQMY